MTDCSSSCGNPIFVLGADGIYIKLSPYTTWTLDFSGSFADIDFSSVSHMPSLCSALLTWYPNHCCHRTLAGLQSCPIQPICVHAAWNGHAAFASVCPAGKLQEGKEVTGPLSVMLAAGNEHLPSIHGSICSAR